MWGKLLEYLPFDEFFNHDKRIYWPYLLLCVLYALIFLLFSRVKVKKIGFNYWFHPSALLDYVMWIGNHIFQIIVFPLLFINSLSIASWLYKFLANTFGEVNSVGYFSNWSVLFYAVSFFILSDFSRFILHYLLHQNQFLWNIHRTHHTAEVLTPITLFRVHPLEMILFQIRFLIVHGTVTGIFIYIYHDVFDFPKILGASFFVIISNLLGGNLRHSPIPIGFGFLEKFFISPKQHQMHHSKLQEMQHSNYGSFFAFWDVLFSTWKSSKGVSNIEYGVADQPKQSLWKELCYPIMRASKFDKLKLGLKKNYQAKKN